jgi:hypothetical protein
VPSSEEPSRAICRGWNPGYAMLAV